MAQSTLQKKLSQTFNNYRMFGLWQTTKDALLYLLDRRPDNFDQKYGVRTADEVDPRDAQIGDDVARAHAIKYAPTDERVMRHILNSVLDGENPRKFSFVDLGCGKGRALVIASQFAFREVIGVEISELHAQLARENIASYLAQPRSSTSRSTQVQCRDVRVVCDNAANVDLPDGDVLVYMYRPFVGQVFEAVADRLARLRARSQRRIWIAFSAPDEEYMFARRPDFRLLRKYGVISREYSWSLWEVQSGN